LSEYQEEKVPSPQGHQYGNDRRMQQSADPQHLPWYAHPYDLPAGRAKIFSVLHKTKKAGEKILQHSAL